jgi:glycerol-3-phosphate dehydrogenase (NAD(P)+)
MSVAVIGGGAFGTALAIVIAKTQCVKLWARSASHVAELKISQENKYRLPGVKFPKLLKVTSELKDVFDADIILFAIPMQLEKQLLLAVKALIWKLDSALALY